MKTLYRNSHSFASALAATVIVGVTGLSLDQGHAGALPRGVVEIGELQTLQVGDLLIAVLPEIQVIGGRDAQLADVEATETDGARG
jgi:hypothetical protein